MNDRIRLATVEEIERIREHADLDGVLDARVVAFENGTHDSDIAVLRTVTELDPLFFAPETSRTRKRAFVWALEGHLRLLGTIPAFYFNVDADDREWRSVIEKWGAEPVSHAPEIRYKKVLT